MSVPLQNSYVDILMANMIDLRGGTFWMFLCHNGLYELALPFHHVRIQ